MLGTTYVRTPEISECQELLKKQIQIILSQTCEKTDPNRDLSAVTRKLLLHQKKVLTNNIHFRRIRLARDDLTKRVAPRPDMQTVVDKSNVKGTLSKSV